jgi:enamine deaminase RidA (YjgF/YER057c/UK114 family)
MRVRISSGCAFERLAGCSRSVVEEGWIFVSGTGGIDCVAMTPAPDVAERTSQCFRNAARALAEAGATLDDIVCVCVCLTERGDFEIVAPLPGHCLGTAAPANTAPVVGLAGTDLEVTARSAVTSE